MLITIVPLLVAVAGLLIWLLASHAVAKDAGRILFASGAFVTILHLAASTVKVF